MNDRTKKRPGLKYRDGKGRYTNDPATIARINRLNMSVAEFYGATPKSDEELAEEQGKFLEERAQKLRAARAKRLGVKIDKINENPYGNMREAVDRIIPRMQVAPAPPPPPPPPPPDPAAAAGSNPTSPPPANVRTVTRQAGRTDRSSAILQQMNRQLARTNKILATWDPTVKSLQKKLKKSENMFGFGGGYGLDPRTGKFAGPFASMAAMLPYGGLLGAFARGAGGLTKFGLRAGAKGGIIGLLEGILNQNNPKNAFGDMYRQYAPQGMQDFTQKFAPNPQTEAGKHGLEAGSAAVNGAGAAWILGMKHPLAIAAAAAGSMIWEEFNRQLREAQKSNPNLGFAEFFANGWSKFLETIDSPESGHSKWAKIDAQLGGIGSMLDGLMDAVSSWTKKLTGKEQPKDWVHSFSDPAEYAREAARAKSYSSMKSNLDLAREAVNPEPLDKDGNPYRLKPDYWADRGFRRGLGQLDNMYGVEQTPLDEAAVQPSLAERMDVRLRGRQVVPMGPVYDRDPTEAGNKIMEILRKEIGIPESQQLSPFQQSKQADLDAMNLRMDAEAAKRLADLDRTAEQVKDPRYNSFDFTKIGKYDRVQNPVESQPLVIAPVINQPAIQVKDTAGNPVGSYQPIAVGSSRPMFTLIDYKLMGIGQQLVP